jgi:hypothetical protein
VRRCQERLPQCCARPSPSSSICTCFGAAARDDFGRFWGVSGVAVTARAYDATASQAAQGGRPKVSSHRTTRVRLVTKLVVTTMVSAVIGTVAWAGAAAAVAADIAYPSLVGFEVQSRAVVPDEPVTISYDATSEMPLRSVTFSFTNQGRSYVARTAPDPAVAGQVQLVIPDGAKNGTWQLWAITLVTTSSAQTTYLRSGAVSRLPSTPAEQHVFDLPTSDVMFSGSMEDVAYPDVKTLTTSAGTFSPGQQVTVDYLLEDQTGVEAITVWLREPRTGRNLIAYRQLGTPPVPLTGSLILTLDDTVANGTYAIDAVRVRDVMGNEATYRSNGTVTTPSGDQVLGHHDLPLGGPCFTVTGSTADHDPPELTSFTVADRTAVTGQPVSVSYAFAEQKDNLASLTAVWQIDGGAFVEAKATNAPTTGSLSGPTSTEGVARLAFISVSDGTNFADYHRDGTLYTGSYPASRHTFDFSTRDVTVGSVPGAPVVTAVPGNGSTTIRWQPPAAHASPITAYKVTASPGGRIQSIPGTGRSATFTGLANGTAYTFSVTATNGFGTGRAGTAKATPGPFVHIAGIGDWDGDWNNDLAAIDSSGNLWAYKGNGRGGFQPSRVRIGTSWQGTRVLTPTNGPLNLRRSTFSSDLTSVPYGGTMVKYAGTSLGRWQATVPMPGSWSAYSRVIGVGEWTEDDQPDLLTVDDSGVMRLHPASGYYAYAVGAVVGTGWGTMRQVFAAGDFSGDNHADLMAVSADGGLHLYKGNGKGGWLGSRVKIGSGWQGFRTVLSPGDFTGDDNADVIAVKPSGEMYLYRGNGSGGFTGGGTRIGTGWGIFL